VFVLGRSAKDNAALRMPFLLPNLLALPPFQTIEHDTDCLTKLTLILLSS
jgi:hypothetical protein